MIGVGDVVVCVDDARRTGPSYLQASHALVRRGSIYRVEAACIVLGKWGVKLIGVIVPERGWWEADRFRKVLPADPAFIERILSLKPERTDA